MEVVMAHANTADVPERFGTALDTGLSDEELLGRFNAHRDGSAEAAFEALVRRHGSMVLRVCGHILADRHHAEDAFQATFLVLARRSGSIRRPELLGNWLYGVALRTAREAKMSVGRRRRLETQSEGLHPEPIGDAGLPEMALIRREDFEALHEEVSRLPERYRVPVVLCELEGLAYHEVARRMRCPTSTIGVRLVRARECLRSRLIRRGIIPAAGLADAVFGAEGASALMGPTLIDSTVQGAVLFAATDGAAVCSVSASAAILTQAILAAMHLARIKAVVSSVLVVALVAGTGWVVGHRHSRPAGDAERHVIGPKARVDSPPAIAARVDPAPAPMIPLAAAPEVREPEQPPPRSIKPLPAATELVQLARHERTRGEALFSKEWAAHDPASPHGDGLGPVFNETSCVGCHGLGAPGGAGPEGKNVVILTATAGGSTKGLERAHPGFHASRSIVLHRYGTDPAYSSWRRQLIEASANRAQGARPDDGEATEKNAVDRLIQRIAEQTSPAGRARAGATRLNKGGVVLDVSERNTPALFGAGKIDSISSEVLVREAKFQPIEVRGKVSRDSDGRVGRFGWKAQVSRLHEFVRVACAGELGLEVSGHPQSASPLAPLEKAKGVDMTEPECDALVSFVRSLPAPVAIDPDGPLGSPAMLDGRHLFAEVGCATCHAPSLGEVRGIYSDLLLHNLGASLSDGGEGYGSIRPPSAPDGPSPGEWRTPPLWGYRDSGPYMHDGRAETLEEAVALHGGQGAKAAQLFFALAVDERSAIEAFLKSLVAPSAASAPGIVLAAELESRFVPDEVFQSEALTRARLDEEEARRAEQQREAQLQRVAADAKRFAPTRLRLAADLEKAGKIAGALEFYRLIAREVPETEEGRSAAERIASLQPRPK
jgi:RNA polymerase sigma factor (sigma-70 family)